MSQTLADSLLGTSRLPLAAFALAMARCLGLLQIVPLATRLGLTGFHRAGVAAALALVCLPVVLAHLGESDVAGARLAVLTAKEAAIGLLLGILFAAPFWAAETAGELIDQQRGSRGAVSPDPISQTESGITATLFSLTLTTIFIVSGGLHWVIEAVLHSYAVWPAASLMPHLSQGAAGHLLGLLDGVLRAGLVIAGPLLIAMLLAELGLALVSRFAPQLNVFDLAMSVKGLVVVVGLPVYAVFLIALFQDQLAPLTDLAPAMRVLSGS